jgi:hypothetical protein
MASEMSRNRMECKFNMNKEASIEHLLMLDISFDITLQNVNLNGAVCLVGRLHLEFNFLLL